MAYNFFEEFSKDDDSLVAAIESSATSKANSKEHPRIKVLNKLNDTIAGLEALNRGEAWPTRKKSVKRKDRATGKSIPTVIDAPYNQLFKLDEITGTYEIAVKYSNTPIGGFFGVNSDGEEIKVVKNVDKSNLLKYYTKIRDGVESGALDTEIEAAKEDLVATLQGVKITRTQQKKK